MTEPAAARDRLLDSAERLFAERGLGGVSLRAINAEAGLSPAALHYHFGSKPALVTALLERRMDTLMERRRARLDALAEAPPEAIVRGVIQALVAPLAEFLTEDGEAGLRYVRLLHRLDADGDLPRDFVAERYREGVVGIGPLLDRALPHLSPGLVRVRLAIAIDAALRSLADWQVLAGRSDPAFVLPALVAALVDFLVAGLEAPAPSVPHPPGGTR